MLVINARNGKNGKFFFVIEKIKSIFADVLRKADAKTINYNIL